MVFLRSLRGMCLFFVFLRQKFWLRLASDCFCFYCLFRVFYNPGSATNISFLGEIWIYKASIMWVSLCILIGVPLCGVIFYEQYWRRNKDFWSLSRKVTRCLGWFTFSLIVWIFGCVFGILLCEMLLLIPIAFSYVCFILQCICVRFCLL